MNSIGRSFFVFTCKFLHVFVCFVWIQTLDLLVQATYVVFTRSLNAGALTNSLCLPVKHFLLRFSWQDIPTRLSATRFASVRPGNDIRITNWKCMTHCGYCKRRKSKETHKRYSVCTASMLLFVRRNKIQNHPFSPKNGSLLRRWEHLSESVERAASYYNNGVHDSWHTFTDLSKIQ